MYTQERRQAVFVFTFINQPSSQLDVFVIVDSTDVTSASWYNYIDIHYLFFDKKK